MQKQKTIAEKVKVEGINVFNGRKNSITFHPRSDHSGLSFIVNEEIIPISLEAAKPYRPIKTLGLASSLKIQGRKEKAEVVEHILFTLYALGIDNLAMELSDGVVPRLDGSVSEYVEKLGERLKDCISPKHFLTINPRLDAEIRTVRSGKRYVTFNQGNDLTVNISIEYPHKAVGFQSCSFDFSKERIQEIMGASPPFFIPLGLRGLLIDSLSSYHGVRDTNSLLVGNEEEERYVNKQEKTDKEEFVKHKVQDFVACLALLQKPLQDVKIDIHQGSQAFDVYAIKELKKRGVFKSYS